MKELTGNNEILYRMFIKRRCHVTTIAKFFKMPEKEVVDWIKACGLPISGGIVRRYYPDSDYLKKAKRRKTTRNVDGYTQIQLENGKWIFEHRYVWQQNNGPIPDGWVIYHLNGIKDDNRIENLLGAPRSNHSVAIHYQDRIKQLESENAKLNQTIETYERLFL